MKVVVTGATGFIGSRLMVELARQGHPAVALVRDPHAASNLPGEAVRWQAGDRAADAQLVHALSGADAVIHLAGHSIAESRWTPKVKARILDSRVHGTRQIVDALSQLPEAKRPRALISASAIGYYGERGDEVLTEGSAPGRGFLPDVVQAWETEAKRAEALPMRVVRMRLGIVLGHEGGALAKMQPVVLGSGRQWMSWVHVEDVVRFVLFSLERSELSGAFNLTAPNPLRNVEFTDEFGKATGQSTWLKVPELALRATLGEMAEVVLQSCRVLPEAALAAGFEFSYAHLKSALRAIYPSANSVEKRFTSVQYVPQPLEKVFAFFSAAENLEALTPPWLGFRVLGQSTPAVGENTLIDYKLKIHGVPVRWQSRIESWVPNVRFVDTQTRGPYRQWHHTHRFEEVPGGTLVSDEVRYRVPGGKLGAAVAGIPVRWDIEKIFAYRRNKIAEIFSRHG